MDYLDDDADDAAIEAAAAAAAAASRGVKRGRSAEQAGSAGGDDGGACEAAPPPASDHPTPPPPPFTGTSTADALRAIATASGPSLTGPEWGWAPDDAASDPLSWKGVVAAGDEGGEQPAVAELNLADAAAVTFPVGALAALAPGLVSLRVSGCGLTPANAAPWLDADLPACTALTSLALDGNFFPALPSALATLPSLGALYVGLNPMKALGPPADGLATTLHTLDVAGCQLTALPDALTRLDRLQVLVANNNALASLPAGFGALTALRRLSLHDNELVELPPSFTALSSLNFCTLNCNRLTSLPDLGALPLSRLSLHFNALSALPSSLGSNIEAVSAFGNNITELPGELLASFPGIVRLSLYKNKLTSLPPEVGLLTSLVELWLYDNAIASLPPTIGSCTSLQRLWLTGNALAAVPEELGRCGALQELYVDRNPALRSMPPSLAACTRLRRLFCDPGLELVPELEAVAERGGGGGGGGGEGGGGGGGPKKL